MDFYEIMGLVRTATDEEISKAYRKLARQFHPDRNPGDAEAENMFKKVTEAYESLSNPDKRRQYDAQGYVGRKPPSGWRPTPPPQPPRPPDKPKTKEDFERERVEKKRKEKATAGAPEAVTQAHLDAIPCTFFGGGDRGRSIMTQMKLTPAEMKKGGHKTVTVKRRLWCPACVGDGQVQKPCPRCHGDKPDVGWCPICDGMGATPTKCHVCNGEGVHPWSISEVRVVWSSNVQPGHTVNVLGEGEAAPGKPPGNLRVIITQ